MILAGLLACVPNAAPLGDTAAAALDTAAVTTTAPEGVTAGTDPSTSTSGGSTAGTGLTGSTTDFPLRYPMVYVEAGTFVMGCTDDQQSLCQVDEWPPHQVTLTQDYWLGATEVTRELWTLVMGDDPSEAADCPDCPVENITWFEAAAFANGLSILNGLEPAYTLGPQILWDRDSEGFRLPTEAEWEYAARAGEATLYAGSDEADAVAWYRLNSLNRPRKVAQLAPNAFGAYDMSGNVWEWCWDAQGDYPRTPVVDPIGPAGGVFRMHRGGSWYSEFTGVRVADRRAFGTSYASSVVGLRLVRDAR